MDKYENLRILPRRDTEEKWNEINPVLREDEFIVIVVDKTCKKYKLGDGVHKYSELPFHTFKYCLKFGYLYGYIMGAENFKFKVKIDFLCTDIF